MNAGTLAILNVGGGDTKLSFDPKDTAERKRAKATVTDMLRRGYAILVEVGKQDGEPIYRRVKRFEPKTCEYVIAGVPETAHEEGQTAPAAPKKTSRKKAGRKAETRVPASKTRAVAVARSAGG